jgi:uncharacterized SAM-binding protein YcdF (DUF218 family)
VRRFLAGAVLAAIAAVLAWGEWENGRASRLALGTRPGRTGSGEAIVVLGFRNRGVRLNAVNRWRVRAAVRSRSHGGDRSVLVFSGGAVGGEIAEADLMARYAREELHDDGERVIERTSRTTWENIERAIPFIEHADRIAIVSNPFHAAKARVYLRRQRPDLAERLVRADDNRIGEWLVLKPVLAVVGLRSIRGLEF